MEAVTFTLASHQRAIRVLGQLSSRLPTLSLPLMIINESEEPAWCRSVVLGSRFADDGRQVRPWMSGWGAPGATSLIVQIVIVWADCQIPGRIKCKLRSSCLCLFVYLNTHQVYFHSSPVKQNESCCRTSGSQVSFQDPREFEALSVSGSWIHSRGPSEGPRTSAGGPFGLLGTSEGSGGLERCVRILVAQFWMTLSVHAFKKKKKKQNNLEIND